MKRKQGKKLVQLEIKDWERIRRNMNQEEIGLLWVLKLVKRRVWMEGLKGMLLEIGD